LRDSRNVDSRGSKVVSKKSSTTANFVTNGDELACSVKRSSPSSAGGTVCSTIVPPTTRR